MARVFVNESSLQDIGNAIREKNGSQDTYTPSQMGSAIRGIQSGGGGDIPEEALTISGDCSYMFVNGKWDWFINQYGDRITTKNISNCNHMFQGSRAKIPLSFEINYFNGYGDFTSMFYEFKFKNLPKINGQNIDDCSNISYLFSDSSVEEVNLENFNINFNVLHKGSRNMSGMFTNCNFLKKIDKELLKNLYNSTTSQRYALYNDGFRNCHNLLKLEGIPVYRSTFTSNCFNQTFYNCYMLKELIFDTDENNQPYVVNWSNQKVDLIGSIGWSSTTTGISSSNRVTDDATYQQYKNTEDWWTTDIKYSRYNHDSAVNTINSLPDVSQGSSNVIKFESGNGELTDGGAINTLTEAEIAVASAKGWTVTFV